MQKSIGNFVFRPKTAIFWRAGMKEGGLLSNPTSFSIFDSYDIKSLQLKFGHDVFKIASLLSWNDRFSAVL